MKKQITIIFLAISFQFTVFAGSFTEHHTVACGETLRLGAVGYPTWNEAEIIQSPTHGVAGIVQGNTSADSLVYHAASGYFGTDTLVVLCALATQITCDTGIYIIETSCANAGWERLDPIGLQVFPNPTSGVVFIKTSEPLAAAKLRNATGQLILERHWELGAYHTELPIGNVPNGVYWLEIRLSAGVVTRKVIVGNAR